jgi:hypothetical protein
MIGAQADRSNVQFKQSTRRVVIVAAVGHIARRLLDNLMDKNDASCPRMPRIPAAMVGE